MISTNKSIYNANVIYKVFLASTKYRQPLANCT